jgi:predicted methyltransferase
MAYGRKLNAEKEGRTRMTRHPFAARFWQALLLLCAAGLCMPAAAIADVYDAAVAHAGRSDADLKRDPLDHPADILRLSGIKSGMRVADVLAGDGYYSELASYVVGPKGKIFMINNAAFDHWSEGPLQARLANDRLGNVEHETLDLNHMNLKPARLDAVFLIKVYHDLYWVDSSGATPWPKIDTGSVLDQLAQALKPGGILLLVDHSAKAGSGNTAASPLHRIEESYAVKDFESRGFKVVAKSDVLRRPDDARDQISYKGPALGKTDRFVLVFRKTAH